MAFTNSKFNSKSALSALMGSALLIFAAGVAAKPTTRTTPLCFTGDGSHFNRSAIPSDFTPCGGNCPSPSKFTLPIALPSTLFNGANFCCSSFSIRFNGQTAQGTYAYKSSNLADTENLVLDSELFAMFADPEKITDLSPVEYCM
ncbi:hypothetical protein D9758_014028 [Tetrapyrgos nigripes]|uniref:Uncharacterized protein n=1 Tax=Tetrapyrgos nigripes TaxID=182062 RepID=A0A8H5CZB2_9AGAR|nr:hypothetical protein D9758_014028 [Tetrapyrgos nigripes]